MYYEAHITFEPVFGYDLDKLKFRAENLGFKVADLVMLHGAQDKYPALPRKDAFVTARGYNYESLVVKVMELVTAMAVSGIKVLRYKIEDTLCDSKIQDVLSLLPTPKPKDLHFPRMSGPSPEFVG